MVKIGAEVDFDQQLSTDLKPQCASIAQKAGLLWAKSAYKFN
jgi:hypothetical protein